MKERQIVYHESQGFGIVISVSDEWADVLFSGEKHIRTIYREYLMPVDRQLIQLSYTKYIKNFNKRTIERGTAYYQNDSVHALGYRKDKPAITALVDGSDGNQYAVNISTMLGRPRYLCTCPVGVCCKHAYAVCLTWSNCIKKLSEASEVAALADMAQEDLLELCSRHLPIESILPLLERANAMWDTEPVTAARMYERIWKKNKQKPVRDGLAAELNKHPDAVYLADYLSHADDWQRYGYREADISVETLENEPPLRSPEALWRFFSAQFSIKKNIRIVYVCYRLNSPDGDPVMELLEDEEGNIEESICSRFSSSLFRSCVRELRTHIWAVSGRHIEEEFASEKRKLEEEAERRRIEAFVSSTEQLCRQLNTDNALLDGGQRVSLDYTLSFLDRDEGCELSFKVGINRKYAISRPVEFLERVERKAFYQYGKYLAFTHLPENFDERSKAVIRLLLTYRKAFVNPYVYTLSLSAPLVMELLYLLKGTTVNMQDKKVLVRLDRIPVQYTVSDDLRLSCCIGDERYLAVPHKMGDTLLLHDVLHNTLDIADIPFREMPLLFYAMKNDGMDLTPVLPLFNEGIYTRFHDRIEVAEKVRDKVRVSELCIRAYFDYRDECIDCREELYLDGTRLTAGDLTRSIDIARHNQFTACLSQIGFQDGVLSDDTAVLMFFRMDFSELKRLCDVYLSDSIQSKRFSVFAKQTIRIQYQSGMMEAFLQPSEYDEEDLEQLYRAIRRKRKFLLLKGDRIVALDTPEAQEFAEAVTDLGLDAKRLYAEKELSMVKALRATAHENACQVDEYLLQMLERLRNFQSADIPLPALHATLRPYQADGFRWLRILSDYNMGGILADDMGLGKTLEIIALLASDETQMPSLIVCPKSLVFNWKNEISRFLPELEAVELYGTAASRKKILAAVPRDRRIACITSYDSLRKDIELYEDIRFRYVVLDEAQYIKNTAAQKSRNVKLLKADHRFALTGTPIENNVLDLWSIFDFVLPGYFEEQTVFKGAHDREGDAFLMTLSKRIAPFVLRRTKEDVLTDLPEKYERILTADMTTAQRKVYDAYVKQARERMQEGGSAFEILPYLTRLRQICVDPGMFLEEYGAESGKLNELEVLLKEYLAAGHRILLFSQFVKGLHSVEAILRREHIAYFLLTGDTPAPERLRMVEQFNRGTDAAVFLISLKAGGTGLNLVGADTVIHLDPWWNVAAEEQAADRAHRIGQTKNVEVIKLVCADSVEQRVIELQNRKKDVIDKVISKDETSVTGASLEDISFLLRKG